ncbi:MAG TPA: endonuclease/exonuclease/phosphatase family protein [Acidimicrobiales bacterium]|nr:endonuclease/exonuclease/phosphatase family protein [Acidimicrobiales bacterium]
MRVATWNVRHGRPQRGFASNRRLAHGVAALGAAVVAAQEVDLRVIRSWFADQPRLLAGAAEATCFEFAPARRLAVTGRDGIVLCVRGSASFRHLSLPHAWGQPRVALIADARVDEVAVTIVATHLQNEANEARRQLDWLLEEIAPLSRPCVLLGDLNLRPDDVADLFTNAGFELAGGPPTEPAWSPTQRIDHIAVAGLTIDAVTIGDAPVSDHLPLVATLTPPA